MRHLTKALNRAWRFMRDREWAAMLGFIAFLVANAQSIAEFISGELEKAGESFDWRTLLFIAVGLATRYGVWSNKSVDKVAEAEYRAGRINANQLDPDQVV